MSQDNRSVLALAGGVGGAKLAFGLSAVLPAEALTVAVNTADDFEHLGLSISPDLDTVMYTLAGVANPETGWGRRDESWNTMAALEQLGGETWFRLGDKDLATHIERTRRLRAGETLTTVTRDLAQRLGVKCAIVPMTDNPVRTVVTSDRGDLAFQDWFVRLRCEPAVERVRFTGADKARANPVLLDMAGLRGVIFCPSNPFVSVAPILAIPGVRTALQRTTTPRVAVTPIVRGQAIKGPAAKMLAELGHDVSALGVARYYKGLIDGFVLDQTDAGLKASIEDLGIKVLVADTMMRTDEDKRRLAVAALEFVDALARTLQHS
ncbi:2-phospho-L-lactate transferase [Enhydrobacter sp.]|jgi:LPPG:FO 2-phospho-L-lactate transferase|uniref:2-phospho-L-lactate transferase n=1 Tax=Enhydrobacter sp. TaxID=1894999 RepID=UPI002610C9DA|nr:2-phospho-L-lactate transferase [Enhydrobacter sp.]WIM10329.1 MAG: LPPG:FO 2-phospho-L-lactate transferase [Enhydrobacter sp.]